jgi:hypothetical protein
MRDRTPGRRWAAVAAFFLAVAFPALASVAVPAGAPPAAPPDRPTAGPTPFAGTSAPLGRPTPTPPPLGTTPSPLPSGAGPQPAPATPVPSGLLVRFAGQLLDDRDGFVFFTTGDGYRLDPAATTVDYATGKPSTLKPATGIYALASFNPQTGLVVQLAVSRKPIPAQASYEDVQRFAVALSTPEPNPELVAKEGVTGNPVLVTFTALVPVGTALTDIVYMQTDQSNWSPQAIRLDRIDALHYRVTLRLNSGTEFLYRYTRGTSQSVEVGRNGLQIDPRKLYVKNLEVKNQDDTIYNWADQNPAGNAPPGPDSIPTPYNPQPFPVPFPPRPTLPPK